MKFLILSALTVGILHSLSPGHWLPVVLMAKSRKWSLKTSFLGALATAFGHILFSLFLAIASAFIEMHFFMDYEDLIEKYAGLALCFLGLIFALIAFFTQWSCHHHSHARSKTNGGKAPFFFLFSLGFSPCIAVLPLVAQATIRGGWALFFTFVSFSLGVIATLLGATFLVFMGILKLDHPLFDHYGDVIAGLGVSLMGLLLFLFSH